MFAQYWSSINAKVCIYFSNPFCFQIFFITQYQIQLILFQCILEFEQGEQVKLQKEKGATKWSKRILIIFEKKYE